MNKIFIVTQFGSFFAWMKTKLQQPGIPMKNYQNISIETARALLNDQTCVVLDVRDERSFNSGRLPNAQHFNNQLLRQFRKTTAYDRPILVYCYHGHSSQDIARMLCDFGYSTVYSLEGGYAAWELAQQQPRTTVADTVLPMDISDWFIEHGFDPTQYDRCYENGFPPLMHACRHGLEDIVRGLLGLGADSNLTNDDGNNALWLACFADNEGIVDLLIQHGTAIDNQNTTGATALMYAASAGKAPMVKLLLEAGADLNIKNQDDFTALDLAANIDVLKLLRKARAA